MLEYKCIFFRKTTLCYISPERDLQMSLAFNVFVYLESVARYKFGFTCKEFGFELGSKYGLKLNLNWNFEVFF